MCELNELCNISKNDIDHLAAHTCLCVYNINYYWIYLNKDQESLNVIYEINGIYKVYVLIPYSRLISEYYIIIDYTLYISVFIGDTTWLYCILKSRKFNNFSGISKNSQSISVSKRTVIFSVAQLYDSLSELT